MPKLSAENKELITAAVRDRTFECACAILREEGWRQFTMEKLASRMGVAKGTIYNYFRDREAVILFIMESEIAEFAGELREQMEKYPDTMDFLKDFIRISLRRFEEFRFLRLAIGELLRKAPPAGAPPNGGSDERFAPIDRAGQKVLDVLTGAIARGMDEGVLRRADPALTASVFFGALLGMDMAGSVDPMLDLGRPEVRQAICALLLKGLAEQTVLLS